MYRVSLEVSGLPSGPQWADPAAEWLLRQCDVVMSCECVKGHGNDLLMETFIRGSIGIVIVVDDISGFS